MSGNIWDDWIAWPYTLYALKCSIFYDFLSGKPENEICFRKEIHYCDDQRSDLSWFNCWIEIRILEVQKGSRIKSGRELPDWRRDGKWPSIQRKSMWWLNCLAVHTLRPQLPNLLRFFPVKVENEICFRKDINHCDNQRNDCRRYSG